VFLLFLRISSSIGSVGIGGGSNKNVRKGLGLIWLATVGVLWKARNDKIFNDVNFEVDKMVEDAKVLAWRWMLSRMRIPVCLFYEWCWNPQWCLRWVCIRV